ncbi:discoidin domain-containing protein [Nitrospira sp. Nam74]
MLRKQVLQPVESYPSGQEISIADVATVLVTSELSDHPIDHMCDGQRGPGSTRWIAEQSGDQTIVLAFDTARTIETVSLEIEEREVSRTQELTLAVSRDGGQTYQEVLRQEFNFSPSGATFEHEKWRLGAEGITNLRVWIRPDKGGKPCRASITSLVLQ